MHPSLSLYLLPPPFLSPPPLFLSPPPLFSSASGGWKVEREDRRGDKDDEGRSHERGRLHRRGQSHEVSPRNAMSTQFFGSIDSEKGSSLNTGYICMYKGHLVLPHTNTSVYFTISEQSTKVSHIQRFHFRCPKGVPYSEVPLYIKTSHSPGPHTIYRCYYQNIVFSVDRNFQHENLVKLYGVCTAQGPVFIIQELMTQGRLKYTTTCTYST